MGKNVECINSVYFIKKFCEFEVCHGVRANWLLCPTYALLHSNETKEKIKKLRLVESVSKNSKHWVLVASAWCCVRSDVCDNAEEWRWSAYSQFLLLGQHYRWCVTCLMLSIFLTLTLNPRHICLVCWYWVIFCRMSNSILIIMNEVASRGWTKLSAPPSHWLASASSGPWMSDRGGSRPGAGIVLALFPLDQNALW